MRMRLYPTLVAVLAILLCSALSVSAQDPGTPDSLYVDSVLVRSAGSHGIPVSFTNDQTLAGFEITLNLPDPRVSVDSFSFTDGRVAYLNTRGIYTNGDNVSIYAIVLSENLIPAGSGLLGELFVSIPEIFDTFAVVIDTSSYIDNGALHTTFFSDAQNTTFQPQYDPGFLDARIGSCCIGTRGDASGDGSDTPDPVDLATLVDYLFGTPPDIACPEEADINGDGDVDPVDLAFMVDYLFGTPPQLVPCP